MTSLEHIPSGDPCRICSYPFLEHRVYHASRGNPCNHCGLPASRHRTGVKKRIRKEHESMGDPCSKCGEPESNHRGNRERKRPYVYHVNKQRPWENILYLGVDGEGQGRLNHKYVLLAVSSRDGSFQRYIQDPNGLKTVDCLEFFLNLPRYTKSFAYSFNYDLTKILEDLPDKILYYLFRPELRARRGQEMLKGPKPVKWNGYRLNLQGTKFTVYRDKKRWVLWDIWKFYQSKFVNALKDWKVGSPELWERMQEMKEKRSEFDKEKIENVREYCLEECQCMAELAERLVEAHNAAGLKLKSFYGAGSSATAMLTEMQVRDKIVRMPDELEVPISCAFFGGRFENSLVGPVTDTEIYSRDISSAYPYQLTFLPCLLHGTWEHTNERKRLDESTVRQALVRYSLSKPGLNPNFQYWAPFPFRTKGGSITFPSTSDGGWIWRDEYRAGENAFPNVQFEEAYLYHCACDCKPFEEIPQYYCERCRIGKEGPGIIIKLGCNSCYGKLAQSVGRGQFNSWMWAGIITSGCRAQILECLGLLKNWESLLMVATDGIMTTEDFLSPLPRGTGTEHTGKPLGGWERKVIDKNRGMFFARPGIYFPFNPTKKELKDIRGRGIGKQVLLESWASIINHYQKFGADKTVEVMNVSRFCGAKSSISRAPSTGIYTRANNREDSKPRYGQWITRKVEMSFCPLPKREGIATDGRHLTLRDMSGQESQPYRKTLSKEAIELKLATAELEEQPDVDFIDYELEDY